MLSRCHGKSDKGLWGGNTSGDDHRRKSLLFGSKRWSAQRCEQGKVMLTGRSFWRRSIGDERYIIVPSWDRADRQCGKPCTGGSGANGNIARRAAPHRGG